MPFFLLIRKHLLIIIEMVSTDRSSADKSYMQY